MRDNRIDTLKGIMIFLVVVGHYFEHLIDDENFRMLYAMIYLVHMPVFVYLSGLTFNLSGRKRNTGFIVFCIVIGQLLFSSVSYVLYGNPWSDYWILWYLYAIIAWSEFTQLIKVNLWTVLMAILAALAWGVFPQNDVWRFSRIVGFYPYFLLGYLQIHKRIGLNKILWPLSIAGAVGAAVLLNNAAASAETVAILYNSNSYSVLNQSVLEGVSLKALLYVVGFTAAMLLMHMGYSNGIFAKWGKHSIAIYLAHGALAKTLSFGLQISDPIILGLSSFATAAMISYSPATDWLRKSYSHIRAYWVDNGKDVKRS